MSLELPLLVLRMTERTGSDAASSKTWMPMLGGDTCVLFVRLSCFVSSWLAELRHRALQVLWLEISGVVLEMPSHVVSFYTATALLNLQKKCWEGISGGWKTLSPLLSSVTKEVLLMPILDALLADPSTSQSTLFLFRSMQRGKRIKEKRLYQRRQLRNGSDLTIWWEEHRLLHVGIFAVTWGTTR